MGGPLFFNADGPGSFSLLMSPNDSWGITELDTLASNSAISCCDAKRVLSRVKTLTSLSLAPQTISPFGWTDTLHTEMAGNVIVWIHSP